MKTIRHRVQFCVVGGGLAGICAAIAAARHGVKTLIVQDRPVFGGNASSEIRMWVCGSPHHLETGLVEEFRLENLYRNNYPCYSIWDSILFEKVRFQENLTSLLNASCRAATVEAGRIRTIEAWQTTTETTHIVEADLFADCSGDGIMAVLAGAEHRIGREAKREFGESLAPDRADRLTMGLSCLIQARETDRPQKFIPPKWAHVYPDEASLPPNRDHDLDAPFQNYWYLELGGDRDSIGDAESIRDELLKTALGLWDHIKNRGDHHAENWALDWIGFLPGKRESRRLIGDCILTEKEIRAGVLPEDMVAYGGWPIDDHHPEGFYSEFPNRSIDIGKPYGIPLRCLYSRNVGNLFFAGRNISCSHVAISSTRVMATCACLGQAVGTAAFHALRSGFDPRGCCRHCIGDIQRTLLDDDCFLPGRVREIPEVCRHARLDGSNGGAEALRSGIDRELDGAANAWECGENDWAEYDFGVPRRLSEVRLVFDSRLTRNRGNGHLNMIFNRPLDTPNYDVDPALVKAFHLEADGQVIFRETNNYQRLVKIPVSVTATKLRLAIDRLRGEGKRRVFAFDAR